MLKVSSVFSTSWWTDNLKQKKPKLLKEGSLYKTVKISNFYRFFLFFFRFKLRTPIYGDLNYLLFIAMSVITTCLESIGKLEADEFL